MALAVAIFKGKKSVMRWKGPSASAVALGSSSRLRLVCGQKTFSIHKKIQFHPMFFLTKKFRKNVRHFPANVVFVWMERFCCVSLQQIRKVAAR